MSVPQLGDNFPPDSGTFSTTSLMSDFFEKPCGDGELTISLTAPFYI